MSSGIRGACSALLTVRNIVVVVLTPIVLLPLLLLVDGDVSIYFFFKQNKNIQVLIYTGFYESFTNEKNPPNHSCVTAKHLSNRHARVYKFII